MTSRDNNIGEPCAPLFRNESSDASKETTKMTRGAKSVLGMQIRYCAESLWCSAACEGLVDVLEM